MNTNNPYQDSLEQPKEWTLRDYIDLVLRHIWLIITFFILGLGAAVWYTMSQPDTYRAESIFVTETQDMGVGMPGTALPMKTQTRPFAFYEALLKSPSFIKFVMDEAETDPVKPRFEKLYQDQTYWQFLMENLSLKQSDYEEMIVMNVVAIDSVIAFRTATIAINAFKERLRQVEQEESYNVVEFVNQQKELAWEKLEQAERDLERFNETTQINLAEEDGGIRRRLMELENQLAEVETQKELARANINAIQQRLSELKGSTAEKFSGEDSPRVKQLRQQLDRLENERLEAVANNPNSSRVARLENQIDQAKNDMIQAILESSRIGQSEQSGMMDSELMVDIQKDLIQEELTMYRMQNRERYYEQLINKYKRQHPEMLESTLELSRLQRTRKVYENLYNFLVERGEEANIKAATSTGGIRIIDQPKMPKRPIPVPVKRNFAMGALLGLALGIGLAFTLDYFDNSIRNPEQLHQTTHLPILATVQTMDKKQKKVRPGKKIPQNGMNGQYGQKLLTSISPRDPVTDQYRGLRTNLQFASADEPIKKLLVTSPNPGEGKTLTCSNLGIIFSELGKKVLIVDADLRKPMQHSVFHLEMKPGLTEILARDVPFSQSIRKTDLPNLYVLTSGTRPPNPAEMISSEKMNQLLDQATKMFDLVLVDSPPVNVVTDPVLLAAKIKNVAMVVRFGETDIKALQNARDTLQRARATIHGLILNDVHFSRAYGYYSKYAYYSAYYTAEKS